MLSITILSTLDCRFLFCACQRQNIFYGIDTIAPEPDAGGLHHHCSEAFKSQAETTGIRATSRWRR